MMCCGEVIVGCGIRHQYSKVAGLEPSKVPNQPTNGCANRKHCARPSRRRQYRLAMPKEFHTIYENVTCRFLCRYAQISMTIIEIKK
jgi:hypothetical protein